MKNNKQEYLVKNGLTRLQALLSKTAPRSKKTNNRLFTEERLMRLLSGQNWRLPVLSLLLLGAASADAGTTFTVPATDSDGTFTVSWSGDAHYISIFERSGTSGGWGGAVWGAGQSSGTKQFSKSFGTYQYYLKHCTYTGGSTPQCESSPIKTITIAAAPTVSASFSPATISEGKSTKLRWNSSNASSCSATGVSGVNSTSGQVNYTAPSNMKADLKKSVTVTCSGKGGKTGKKTTLHVNWVNDVPKISNIGNHTINEDGNTGAIALTVSDEETADGSLTLSATSSNTSLLPSGNIAFGGSGKNRSVTARPKANKSGSATVTITVADGHKATRKDSFVLTVNAVNDAPTISKISDRSTAENTATGNINFTIGDVETSTNALVVTASSNNTSLIPNKNITLGGSGSKRTINIQPVPIVTGSSTITLGVKDGNNKTSQRSFVLTVTDLPAIVWASTSNSTTGNYKVFWDRGKHRARVYEKFGSANWNKINTSNNNPIGELSISKRVNGTYYYKIEDCEFTGPNGAQTCTQSDSTQVKVSLPPPTINASFSPDSILEGQTATLSWSTSLANSCSATGISGVSGTSGSTASYTAPDNMSENQSHKVTITCTGPGGKQSRQITLPLQWVNDPPTVTAISNQTVYKNNNTDNLAFTVGDEETAAGALKMSATSSNTSLVPNNKISFACSGAHRTVKITPAANKIGTTTITLTVRDANDKTASTRFSVQVNQSAVIYEYDELGRLTTVTNTENRRTAYEYDAADNRVKKSIK